MSKIEFTHEDNLKDSGMSPGERGEPIRSSECELAAKKLSDPYACQLLTFLNRRVNRLANENASLRQEVEITRKLNEALRKENRDLKATLDQSAEHGGAAHRMKEVKPKPKFIIEIPRSGIKFLRIEMDGLLRSIEIGCNGTESQARIVRSIRRQLVDHEKSLK